LSDLLGGAAPKAVIYTALANFYSFVIFLYLYPAQQSAKKRMLSSALRGAEL